MPWNRKMLRMAKKIEKDWNWTIHHFFLISTLFYEEVSRSDWMSFGLNWLQDPSCFTLQFFIIFFGVFHLATFIFFFLNSNKPELCAVIDPCMDLTPFPISIEWDSNQRSTNHELSTLTTRQDFCPFLQFFNTRQKSLMTLVNNKQNIN